MSLFLTRFLLSLGALLPLSVLHAVGAAAGLVASAVPNRSRQITERNLELCLPELSSAKRRRLARRSLIEAGKAFMELGAFWKRPRRRVLGMVTDAEGEVHLDAVLEAGRGVILAGPHLGAWELMGLWLSTRGPMATLYRPPHTPEFESLLREQRGRFGSRLVRAGRRGLRELFRELRNGSMVAILPDQLPSGGQGVFAPFFGIQAHTMTLLPKLAQRTGLPVVTAWAERLPRGRGYCVHIGEPWQVPPDMPLEHAAAELNRRIETEVRRRPEQYQWAYKRFSHRPPGEPALYPPKRRYSGRKGVKIE